MLSIIAVLLLYVAAVTDGAIQLTDIQYGAPTCEVGPYLLRNTFGQLALQHDLLTGQQISLDVALFADGDAQPSCKLCQLSDTYCNTPLNNNTKLRLAFDTSYNFQVVVLANQSQPPITYRAGNPVYTFFLHDPVVMPTGPTPLTHANATIINNDDTSQWCGRTVAMVITARVTIEAPVMRDFVLVAHQRTESSEQVVPCSLSAGQQALSCFASSSYWYVVHRVTNCLATWDSTTPNDRYHTTTAETTGINDAPWLTSITPVKERRYYDAFYYYYEAVMQNNTVLLRGVDQEMEPTLCGAPYLTWLEKTRLDLYCYKDVPLHVALKPWYTTALYAMTAWWNGRQNETALWLALETLERACAQRERVAALNDTVFASMVAVLDESGDSVNGRETVCSWLPSAVQYNALSDGHGMPPDVQLPHLPYNMTLPFYMTHYGEWYFNLFKYVVPMDEDMPWKSVLLVLLPVAVLLIMLVGTAVTIYHICYRPSEVSLNNYHAI